MNLAATAQRGRCCLLMGRHAWTERTVPVWTSPPGRRWSRGRRPKPPTGVTTGQRREQLSMPDSSFMRGTFLEQMLICLAFPVAFSTCEGGSLNCSRDPCPGELSSFYASHVWECPKSQRDVTYPGTPPLYGSHSQHFYRCGSG